METHPLMKSEELTQTPLISLEELQVTWAMGKLVGGKGKNSFKPYRWGWEDLLRCIR
jgi:hypothetical protein